MKPTTLWYAVYTKPKWEKKVAALLSQKGIRNYCPTNKVLKQWHDRKKWIEEPLFTSYVFVCLNTSAEMVEAKKTSGVINFVYWLGKPALIKEQEILVIKDFLSRHREVKLEKTRIRLDDKVQITEGPLISKEGTVVAIHHKTIKVLLPCLGHAMVAKVEYEHVEVLSTEKTAIAVA